MRRVLWFLVGFLVAALPMRAFAEDYPRQVTGYATPSTSTYWPTGAEACAALTQHATYPWRYAPHTDTQFKCQRDGPTGGTNTLYGSIRYGCPYGGTYNATLKLCQSAPPCPAGQARDPVTGQCIEPPCKAGDPVSTLAHYGWTSTWNADAAVWGGKNPASTCSGANNCKVIGLTPSATENCKGIDSLSGTTGPYPVFCWYSGTTSGATCTASEVTEAQKLQQPDPVPCPAGTALGSVNGKSGCYAVSQTDTTKTTNPDGSTTTQKTVTNPDGSKTVETTACDASGNCSTTRQTIRTPDASTGEISVGSGGGTPGSTGSGGSSSGSSDSGQKGDTEQADFCKDNPKAIMCQEKLKIDETGTPQGGDPLKPERDAIGASWDSATTTLQGDTWRKSSLPFVWAPSIPSGACNDWEIYGRSIDLCGEMTMVRQLWSWLIYMLGAFSLWVLGTRAMQGGK